MSWRINVRKLGIGVLFVILLFVVCWAGLTNIGFLQFFLKHVDELLTLFFLVYVALHFQTAYRGNKAICVSWAVILSIGLLSNAIFRYQKAFPALADAFVICSRFVVGYLAAYVYCRKLSKRKKSVADAVDRLVKVITTVLFVLALHDTFLTPLFPVGDYRYFMYSLQLMFPHVTYLSYAGATLLIFLGYRNNKKTNSHLVYMLMASYLCFVSLRSKAIGFLFFYWLLYYGLRYVKKRHLGIMILLGTIGALIVAWDQIQLTFLVASRYSPRSILLKDSLGLMLKQFPLGTGFGTFGSALAATYYSPLYVQCGYPMNWGMTPGNPMFLSDSFWPTAFAQFGVIGTVLFMGIVVSFVKKALLKYKYDKRAGFAMLMTLVYLLIVSMAESAFFNPSTLIMIMLFAVFENDRAKPLRVSRRGEIN